MQVTAKQIVIFILCIACSGLMFLNFHLVEEGLYSIKLGFYLNIAGIITYALLWFQLRKQKSKHQNKT
jgi:hypothetical protein